MKKAIVIGAGAVLAILVTIFTIRAMRKRKDDSSGGDTSSGGNTPPDIKAPNRTAAQILQAGKDLLGKPATKKVDVVDFRLPTAAKPLSEEIIEGTEIRLKTPTPVKVGDKIAIVGSPYEGKHVVTFVSPNESSAKSVFIASDYINTGRTDNDGTPITYVENVHFVV